jgi:hypothetical protein
VSLSDSFLAQMSEDPASKVVQGLQLGAGVAPGVSGGVLNVPFGITEEGIAPPRFLWLWLCRTSF